MSFNSDADHTYCSIVLPVYNEEETIVKNLLPITSRIKKILAGKSFEIIIADNASTDQTKEVVSKIASTNDNIIYIYIPYRGRGGALTSGFRISRGKFIAVLSIDRAWDEIFLKESLPFLQEETVDIVYGPKNHHNSIVARPFYRKIGSVVTQALVAILFRSKLPDTQCIKVFRKDSIPFLPLLNNYNYFAEAEFALRAVLARCTCMYLPVKVKDYRKSSKVRIKSLFEFTREALHFRIYIWNREQQTLNEPYK